MAKKDPGKIKDRAAKFLKKGKLDKALEAYEELDKVTKGKDLKVPQKIAEILAKMGEKEKAVAKYKESAEKYHERGFLIQAIAIYKVMLQLAPDDAELKASLSKLSEERTGVPITKKAPLKKEPPKKEPEKKEPEKKEPEKKEPPKKEPKKPKPPPKKVEDDQDVEDAVDSLEEAIPAPEPEEELEIAVDEPDADFEEEEELAVSADDLDDEIEIETDFEDDDLDDDLEESADIDVVPIEEEDDLPESGPERTPLFSDLSAGEFDRVFESLTSRVDDPGAVIVQEGTSGDSLFIIARGQVKVTHVDHDGEEKELAILGPGDFFGEIGYFYGKRLATVTVVKKSQILEMNKSDLDEVVKEFPRVNEVLLKFYRERVLDNLLGDSPLFQELTDDERSRFAEKFVYRECDPGETIVNEGDPGDSMFLIKSGEVIVQTINPMTEEEVELARLEGGDFFGEVSLVKNKPRTATVVVRKKAEIMELSRGDFQEIAKNHPEIGSALEMTIEQRVEETIKRMMDTMKK